MSTFAEIGVPAELCARLERRGIAEPFPIQTLTLPDALAGRDICGRAPTGSGKTLAFGLAIAASDRHAEARRPRSLVLVPTRELAIQVAREIEGLLARSSKSRVVAIYGGASYGPQRRGLARGASVVVACPGRLEDLVAQEDIWLDDVDLVVVDEADRLADMGFLPAVRRLLDRTSPNRQTLLFSATLDGDVDALVRRYQEDPARHEVVSDDEVSEAVEHVFWRAESAQRLALVRELVDRHGRAIVFCRTRRGAERVAKQLKIAGISAQAIHGNRTQGQRERALGAFMQGRVDALVATDVAARGIHVDDVACVIHFDLPADGKDYIHRSGRTGRAGASGTVVSLVANEHRRALRALQRSLGLPEQLDAPDVVTGRAPVRPAPTSGSEDRAGQRPSGSRPTPASADDGTGGQRRRRRPRPANGSRGRQPARGARTQGASESRGRHSSPKTGTRRR